MIRVSNTEVFGFNAAIRGMRNPKKSWAKSDSNYCYGTDCKGCPRFEGWGNCRMCSWEKDFGRSAQFMIGPADMKLAKALIGGGPEERKFLRYIHVQMDIDAPSSWLAELDTYKVATVRDSTSLQHTGSLRDFEMTDFFLLDELEGDGIETEEYDPYVLVDKDGNRVIDDDDERSEKTPRKPTRLDGETDEEYDYRCSRWQERLQEINWYRKKYRETKNYGWFLEMRRVMPQGYIYRITFDCNYEVLLNMYRQREFHKLPGWQELCRWMKTLPYFTEFVDAMKHKKDA